MGLLGVRCDLGGFWREFFGVVGGFHGLGFVVVFFPGFVMNSQTRF